MKQAIDFEQAKKLVDCGICIPSGFEVNSFNTYIWNDGEPSINFHPAPTIGELIEWIENQKLGEDETNSLYICQLHECNKWEAGIDNAIGDNWIAFVETTELIDALVDLAIKIKEEG